MLIKVSSADLGGLSWRPSPLFATEAQEESWMVQPQFSRRGRAQLDGVLRGGAKGVPCLLSGLMPAQLGIAQLL
jgi:hypothetical protein